MGTKTISIMNDVHSLLLMNKLKNESFSDVIRRVLSKKKNIMKFAGAWKNVSDEVINDMKLRIRKLRKNSTDTLLKNDMYRL